MSGTDDNGSPGIQEKPEGTGASEHLNIKVTDNNNEVFFKIKRTTALKKLMDAFCERQGKAPTSVRFLFDGSRVAPTDSPETVSLASFALRLPYPLLPGRTEADCEADDEHCSSTCKTVTPLKFIKNRSVAEIEVFHLRRNAKRWARDLDTVRRKP